MTNFFLFCCIVFFKERLQPQAHIKQPATMPPPKKKAKKNIANSKLSLNKIPKKKKKPKKNNKQSQASAKKSLFYNTKNMITFAFY